MTFTNVFTGSTIYPAEVSLTNLDLTSDVELFWPLEADVGQPLASRIVQIDSSTSTAWKVFLPDAMLASVGETILFNNLTAVNISVANFDGTTLVSMPAATQWQLYIDDNTTQAGVWEVYQFGATSSTANAGILAGYGLQASGATLETTIPQTNISIDTTFDDTDRASLVNWEGAAGILTLPVAIAVGNNWYMHLRNSGSGSITLETPGTELINGSSSLVFSPGDSATVVSDGTDFFTIGFGQNATFAFDYTVINVAGGSDYTLSGSELNRIAYQFTGLLTNDISIVVPPTVQQYWVYNNTTGPYILSVQTASQVTPLQTTQSTRTIMYCDGTDVVPAVTAYITGTISGGTF